MDANRRDVIAAAAMTMIAGCAEAAPPPPIDWSPFKSTFLKADGRIVDTGNGGISHSEGQGYGMLLAEAANDAAGFASMASWTARVLGRNDVALHSWRYDPRAAVPVGDPNNATDGDILIAGALMRAGRRWKRPDYLVRARAIRVAIAKRLVRRQADRLLLLPGLVGFSWPDRTTVNPAYYVWPLLDEFLAADGDRVWGRVITDGEWLMRSARFGALGLPTDWVDVDGAGNVMPAIGRPPRFGFDAIRVPLYLSLSGRQADNTYVSRFWRGAKGVIPAWIDVTTTARAPFALSSGGMAVVRRILGTPLGANAGDSDYYSAVLGSLARLPTT